MQTSEHLSLQECGLDKFECVIAELADMGVTVAEVIGLLRMTEARLIEKWIAASRDTDL